MSGKIYCLTDEQIESLKAEARADAIHGCSYFDVGGRFMPRSIEQLVRNAYEKGINDCLDIVEKVQAECIKNDGCRNKCDEPYACAYGTRIFGEILALKERENDRED